MYQYDSWQHAVAVVDDFFYPYDYHDGKLSTYPITYLVGKYTVGTYIIMLEKMYEI